MKRTQILTTCFTLVVAMTSCDKLRNQKGPPPGEESAAVGQRDAAVVARVKKAPPENQWERLRVINRVVNWVNNISRGKDDRRKITSNAKIIVGRENRASAEDTATNENLSAI